MLPVLPTKFHHRHDFPFPESVTVECKSSLYDRFKMYETLCAFLNTMGGYFVIGVNDKGAMIGITRAEVDKSLLIVDCIVQTSRIINSMTGNVVSPTEITARAYPLEGSSSQWIIIVRAVSEHPNCIYIVAGSERHYFRLNASNYCSRGSLAGTELELRSEIVSLKHRIASQDIEYRKLLLKMKELLASHATAASMAAAELGTVVDYLSAKILREKALAEAQTDSRQSVWGCLLGVVIDCFTKGGRLPSPSTPPV
jgi:hypothetical protein